MSVRIFSCTVIFFKLCKYFIYVRKKKALFNKISISLEGLLNILVRVVCNILGNIVPSV